jgi:hypothetical protein
MVATDREEEVQLMYLCVEVLVYKQARKMPR